MNPALQQLAHCTEIASLRPALHSICQQYGSVSRLDILPTRQEGRHQALCFLRMDSEEEENRVMVALGVGRFAGSLVVVVDMPGATADVCTANV